ncbi:hypothetical protein [Massilia sp. Dwa41.01b]|uniref:hypothetical protein n=2 Tax=unclassified Massilia TaxID=2609279 RepID=UPI001E2E2389|nr:hypothetical protein [Massilia sp. Dwa41.01b]
MDGHTVRTGKRGGYFLVEWTSQWDPDLGELIGYIPELVRGHRVAIVSSDSGPYPVDETMRAAGWTTPQNISISPIIGLADFPYTPGFDEWYVFDAVPSVLPSHAFVNGWGFTPLADGHSDTEAFWEQVQASQPLHVLGAGTPAMFLVTRDAHLARPAAAWMPLEA